MVEHVTITDPELHEPKGVAAANSGEVYIADGLGSGDWSAIIENVPLLLTTQIDDVSTADTVYIPMPVAGSITRVTSVLGGAIGTGDSTVLLKDSAGSTMATLTITSSGSGAGDVDSAAISTNNVVTQDDYITVETDGASSNAVPLTLTIVVERS